MTRLYKYILTLALTLISYSVFSAAIDATMFPLKFEIISDSTVEVSSDSSYSYLESYTIPEFVLIEGKQYTVTSIAKAAFLALDNLKRVDIPQSVMKIGNAAFQRCPKLTSITLPPNITSIELGTFYGCGSLESIEIPYGVKKIEEGAFNKCTNIKSIKIPSSVTSIGECAFADCPNLTEINIPSAISILEDGLFSGCCNLSNIQIPSGITHIGKGVFQNCKNLKTIIIPSGITSIEDGTFFGCSNLENVQIPNGVTSIGTGAFNGCSNLLNIEIPSTVTIINNAAFLNCSRIKKIIIPSNVTFIGEGAFQGCSELSNVNIPSNIKRINNFTFHTCSNLTGIKIPSSVTSIGYGAFAFSGLQSIIIPSNVSVIEEGAFYECKNLEAKINNPLEDVSIANNSFFGCKSFKYKPSSKHKTPNQCRLFLKAGDWELQEKDYDHAQFHYYLAFITDEIEKFGIETYEHILNSSKGIDSLKTFIDLITIAKSDSVYLYKIANEPENLAFNLYQEANVQYNNGNYLSAIELNEKARTLLNMTNPIDDLYFDDLYFDDLHLDDLYLKITELEIDCFLDINDTTKATILANHFLNTTKQLKNKNLKQYSSRLLIAACTYIELNKDDIAKDILKEALPICKKQYGKYSIEYIGTIHMIATAFHNTEHNHIKALPYEKEAEILINKTKNVPAEIKIRNLISLSILYGEIGDLKKHLEYAEKSVKVVELEVGPSSENYPNVLKVYSLALCANHLYDKAIETATKSMEMFFKSCITQSDSIEYRNSFITLSFCYSEAGETEKAISILEKLLSFNIPDDITKYHVLSELFGYYLKIEDYSKINLTKEKLVELAVSLEGKESPLYANTLILLSKTEKKKGERIMMLQEASKIYEKNYGRLNYEYLDVQAHLINEGFEVHGDNSLNTDLISYLDASKSLYGEETRDSYELSIYNTVRNSLTAYESGNDSVLVNYLVECEQNLLNIESKYGSEDDLYLYAESKIPYICIEIFLLNHDSIYFNKGIQYQIDYITKLKKIYGESNDIYIYGLQELALNKARSMKPNEIKEAIKIQETVVEYYKDKYGKMNSSYALSASLLSVIYYDELMLIDKKNKTDNTYEEKIQKIISIEKEVLDISKKLNDNLKSIDVLINLRDIYDYDNDIKNAASCLKESFSYWKSNNLFDFSMLTSNEKSNLVFSNRWNKYINDYTKYALSENAHPIYSEIAYDAQLFNKGLLLSSELGLRDIISESKDAKSIELFDRLQKIKQDIAKNISDSITNNLRKEYKNIERSLMKESQQYGDYMQNLSVTFSDVQANMKDNDLCIEFVYNNGVYYALALKKSYLSPKSIFLCKEEVLHKKDELYNAIWIPLKEEIKGVETIYFAPTMTLNNLPIESSPLVRDNFLSSKGINLFRVSSTREIIKKQKRGKYDYAVLYGGLQYNADSKVLIESDKQERTNGLRGAISLDDNIQNDLQDRGHLWNYLKESKQEVSEIKQIASSYGVKTELYLDAAGTESTFKNLSKKGVNLLHVATHGSYINSKEGKSEEEQLERSYLALTGANNTERGVKLPEGVDDGILTAAEISRLDLRGLDLVVLSACESGLGDISTEGVYGLQRGFKKAGANTILMSLWNVDDYATKMLMVEFYKNFLKGDSKTTSLKKAQEYVKSQPGYEDPEFWAGFILLDGLD